MKQSTQAVLAGLMGGLLVSITFSGRYTSYVRPGFGPLLLIAGVILVLVAVASRASLARAATAGRGRRRPVDAMASVTSSAIGGRSRRRPDDALPHGPPDSSPNDHHELPGDPGDPGGDGGHDHERSRAPWLILAPILVLLLIAPPALGSAAVRRNAGSQASAGLEGIAAAAGPGADVGAGGPVGGYAPNDGSGHGIGTKAFAKKRPTMAFPPLPGSTDPALTLKEFVKRALYDGANSVSENSITVTGFVAPAGDGFDRGYSLARLEISCCAADANPVQLHVDGSPTFPQDTWVTAVVTAQIGTASQDNDYVPTVDVVSIRSTSQPADPYEH